MVVKSDDSCGKGGVLVNASIKTFSGTWNDREVCYCQSNYIDPKCSVMVPTECYLEIINPAISTQTCEIDRTDSEFYTFSNSGFDPCYFIKDSMQIEFKVNCNGDYWLDEGV